MTAMTCSRVTPAFTVRMTITPVVVVEYRLAQPALVWAAHDAVDTDDLPMAGDPGQRRSDHDPPARGPRLIALGLWLGLEHTGLTPDQRRATWLAIFIPDTLLFAVAWSAAINGAFRTDASPLPVLPLAIFLQVIIGAPLLLLSKRVGQVLDGNDGSWLVALCRYRVFGTWELAASLGGAVAGELA